MKWGMVSAFLPKIEQQEVRQLLHNVDIIPLLVDLIGFVLFRVLSQGADN